MPFAAYWLSFCAAEASPEERSLWLWFTAPSTVESEESTEDRSAEDRLAEDGLAGVEVGVADVAGAGVLTDVVVDWCEQPASARTTSPAISTRLTGVPP